MEYKDEILEEVWRIKESLAKEAGGDMRKLSEIIRVKAEAARKRMVSKPAILNEEQSEYPSS